MYNKPVLKTMLGAIGLATLLSLSACSSDPTTSDAKAAVEANYQAAPQVTCWAHKTLTFPVDVSMHEQTKSDLEILDGLNRSGLATVQMQMDPSNPSATMLHIDLTDKGKLAHVWDPKGGFCVGPHTVKDIVSVVPDPALKGAFDVKYTWTLNAPSWVERDKFSKLTGMATPGTGDAIITKTDQGWRVM